MAAPYTVGDRIKLLHDRGGAGTCYGALEVIEVTRLADGRYRITCDRADELFPTVAVTVDSRGLDRNGYCGGRA